MNACMQSGGCAKDVTDIVKGLVVNEELHVNPHRQPQYMNRTFWPETAGGPAIPRKLAVRYSYGIDGPISTVETKAVPHETEALHVTRDGMSGNGTLPHLVNAIAQDDFQGKISAEDLQGCWGCVCFPAFGAIERKLAYGPDVLVHSGLCLPLLLGYSDPWDRRSGTNIFYKRAKPEETLDYSMSNTPGGCFSFGPGCTCRFCKCCGDDVRRGEKLIPAKEMEGCWGCLCWPGFGAIEKRKADGDDTLWHSGICCPLFLPYNDAWDRTPGTNVFKKRNAEDRIEYKTPGGFICFGIACTMKLC